MYIGFISRSSGDGFSICLFLYGGAPLREAAHQDCCIFCHSPSHTVCSMPFLGFCSPQQAMLLHRVGAHLTLISHCSGNTGRESLQHADIGDTPPRTPSLHSHFLFSLSLFLFRLYHFAFSSSVGKLSFQRPLPQQEREDEKGWGEVVEGGGL